MDKLRGIMSRVLNIDVGEINDDISRNDTEQWDSFNHLLLISEIEKEMGVKFTTPEVEEIKTFRDLREAVSRKKKQDG
jgi:acyl carrier protein